jgi:transposase
VVEFLGKWHGALMVDEFAGYQGLFRGEVIELACMAHARRKFFDLHQANGSPVAAEALRRFGEWYAIEATIREKSVEERARRRKETSQPLLKAFHLWLLSTRQSVADGGRAGQGDRLQPAALVSLGPLCHQWLLPDR